MQFRKLERSAVTEAFKEESLKTFMLQIVPRTSNHLVRLNIMKRYRVIIRVDEKVFNLSLKLGKLVKVATEKCS